MLRDFICVGDQRHPFQEVRQHTGVRHVLVVGHVVERGGVGQIGGEFVCDADEFVEVVQPGQVLRVGGRFQLRAVSGALQHRLDQFTEVALRRVEPTAQFVEHPDETRNRLGRPGIQQRHLAFGGGFQRVGETGSGVLGVHRHASLGAIADAAPRCVEDPSQTDRIAGVVQHA